MNKILIVALIKKIFKILLEPMLSDREKIKDTLLFARIYSYRKIHIY